MGFIADAIGGVFDFVGDVVGGIVDVVGKAVKFAMDNPIVLVAAGIGIAAYAGSIAAASAAGAGAGGAGGAATAGTFGSFANAGAATAGSLGGGAGALSSAGGISSGLLSGSAATGGLVSGGAAATAAGGAALAPTSMFAGAGATAGATAGGMAVAPNAMFATTAQNAASGGFLDSLVNSGKGLLNWAQDNPMLASTGFQGVAGFFGGLQDEKMLKDQQRWSMDFMNKKYDKEYDTTLALEEERRRMEDEDQMQAYGGLLDIQGATGRTNEQLISDAGLLSYQPRFGSPNLGYDQTMNETMNDGGTA